MVIIVSVVMISHHPWNIIIRIVSHHRRRYQTTNIRNKSTDYHHIRRLNTDHRRTISSQSMVHQFITQFTEFHNIIMTIYRHRLTVRPETIGLVWTNWNSISTCTPSAKYCWNYWFSRKSSSLWLWFACCCFCRNSKATAPALPLFTMKADNLTLNVRT